MARIAWSPRAGRDHQIILSTIERESGAANQLKWRRRIAKAVKILEQFPEIGAPVEEFGIEGLREQIVGPYRIIYYYSGKDCIIARLFRAEKDLENAISLDDLI